MTEVIFNDGFQKIGYGAFDQCIPLESIALPSTLVEIGSDAFNGCNNLREVELNGVPQYIKSTAFDDCDALERFLFPTISYRLENLIQTNHWQELEDKQRGLWCWLHPLDQG